MVVSIALHHFPPPPSLLDNNFIVSIKKTALNEITLFSFPESRDGKIFAYERCRSIETAAVK